MFFFFAVCILLSLALPLGLRYGLAWKMRKMQAKMHRDDEEVRALARELDALIEETRRIDRQIRQCRIRRSLLLSRIETARIELEQRPLVVVDRVAA